MKRNDTRIIGDLADDLSVIVRVSCRDHDSGPRGGGVQMSEKADDDDTLETRYKRSLPSEEIPGPGPRKTVRVCGGVMSMLQSLG